MTFWRKRWGGGQSEMAVPLHDGLLPVLDSAGRAGDDLQGKKCAIVEMIDGIAVNKADGDNQRKAKRARIEYSAGFGMSCFAATAAWSAACPDLTEAVRQGLVTPFAASCELLSFFHLR